MIKIIYIILLSLSLFADFDKISSFRANFIQNVTNPNNKVVSYSGEVIAKAPYYMLWIYQSPIEKNIYLNKDFVIVDEPMLEQALFSKLKDEINIISLLKKSTKISKDKYLAKVYDRTYTIKTRDNKITNISYSDEMDNKIEIKFTNFIPNIKIANKRFVFVAPDYYDIIRK